MTEQQKYLEIRKVGDRRLLFLGKLMGTKLHQDEKFGTHDEWHLDGYFLFSGEKWKHINSKILRPVPELFEIRELNEREHFLMLLREEIRPSNEEEEE